GARRAPAAPALRGAACGPTPVRGGTARGRRLQVQPARRLHDGHDGPYQLLQPAHDPASAPDVRLGCAPPRTTDELRGSLPVSKGTARRDRIRGEALRVRNPSRLLATPVRVPRLPALRTLGSPQHFTGRGPRPR